MEPKTVELGGIYTGLEIVNFLIPNHSNEKKYLDLNTVNPNKEVKNFLTFAKAVNCGNRVVDYENSVPGAGYASFLAVFVSPEPRSKNIYDMQYLKYVFLHENAHEYLNEYENDETTIVEQERNANAVALRWSKRIISTNIEDNFLNLDEHKMWVENQLKLGYDTTGRVASNEARGLERRKGNL